MSSYYAFIYIKRSSMCRMKHIYSLLKFIREIGILIYSKNEGYKFLWRKKIYHLLINIVVLKVVSFFMPSF